MLALSGNQPSFLISLVLTPTTLISRTSRLFKAPPNSSGLEHIHHGPGARSMLGWLASVAFKFSSFFEI